VNQGVYGAVVFYKIDRLTRGGAGHLWTLLPEFKALGVKFWSVLEKDLFFNPNPMTESMITFYAAQAQIEIDNIRDRVQRGLQKKVESGMHPGNGGNLYGYRMDKDTWKRGPEKDESAIVQEIFETIASGVSTKKLASMLTAKAVASPGQSLGRKKASHKWFAAGIARIIRNRSYIGETVVNRADKEIEMNGITPPLISVELWERANAALDNKLGRIQQRNEKSFVMLRGVVFCLKCGSRCYPKSDGRGYMAFFCSSQEPERHKQSCGAPTISETWLNHWVWSALTEHLRSKESCERMIEDLKKEQSDLSPLYRDRDRMEKRIRDIEAGSAEIVMSIADTNRKTSIAALQRGLDELSRQRESIDEELNTLSVEIHQRESEQIDIPSLLELQRQFQWGDPDRTPQQKREYILNWGFSVFVSGRSFEIRMRSGKLLRRFDERAALIARDSGPVGDTEGRGSHGTISFDIAAAADRDGNRSCASPGAVCRPDWPWRRAIDERSSQPHLRPCP
jgi:hypothetical protein